jgi:hypothetical protein
VHFNKLSSEVRFSETYERLLKQPAQWYLLSTQANRAAGTTIQVNLKLTLKVRSCC